MVEVERTLQQRFNKSPAQTGHLVQELRRSFPEAWVCGYADLIPRLLNHEKDRHVLAAAVGCGAQSIVTFNTRHFQHVAVRPYDIEVVHPDDFCTPRSVSMKRSSFADSLSRRTISDGPWSNSCGHFITPERCHRSQRPSQKPWASSYKPAPPTKSRSATHRSWCSK